MGGSHIYLGALLGSSTKLQHLHQAAISQAEVLLARRWVAIFQRQHLNALKLNLVGEKCSLAGEFLLMTNLLNSKTRQRHYSATTASLRGHYGADVTGAVRDTFHTLSVFH